MCVLLIHTGGRAGAPCILNGQSCEQYEQYAHFINVRIQKFCYSPVIQGLHLKDHSTTAPSITITPKTLAQQRCLTLAMGLQLHSHLGHLLMFPGAGQGARGYGSSSFLHLGHEQIDWAKMLVEGCSSAPLLQQHRSFSNDFLVLESKLTGK